MSHRISVKAASPSDVVTIASLCTARATRAMPVGKLEEMVADGSLLVAVSSSSLLGAAGIDLPESTIAGPWIQPWAASLRTGPKLLDAAERLAVQFGIEKLSVSPTANANAFFTASGYSPGGGRNREFTRRRRMQRSISRRLTEYARRVKAVGEELGIPGDYGVRHRLRIQPEASELRTIGPDIYGREQYLAPRAAEAWGLMQQAARSRDIELQPVSAFRELDYQAGIVRRKLDAGEGIRKILKVSAAPGYSEHHSGRALDITTPGCEVLERAFAKSPAYAWLRSYAGTFGFSLSYPRGNRHGIAFEPWHWHFRG